MPVYAYACPQCGYRFDERRPVGTETLPCFNGCGGVAERRFVPTLNVLIPEHFRHAAGWHLPERGSARWETQGTAGDSQVHEAREKSFQQFFDERHG